MIPKKMDHYPEYLSDEEVEDPYQVCYHFMDYFDLPYSKKILSVWIQNLSKGTKLSKASAGDLLCFYEHLGQLLEATMLIAWHDNRYRLANIKQEINKGADMMDPNLFTGPLNLRQAWQYFPRTLSLREYIDPYRVFIKVHEYMEISNWKIAMHLMLHTALNDHSMEDADDHYDLMTIKEFLDKLLEAANLVKVREFELRDGDLELKIRKEQDHDNNTTTKTSYTQYPQPGSADTGQKPQDHQGG